MRLLLAFANISFLQLHRHSKENQCAVAPLPVNDSNAVIINEDDLTMLRHLGFGEFGQVKQATWHPFAAEPLQVEGSFTLLSVTCLH